MASKKTTSAGPASPATAEQKSPAPGEYVEIGQLRTKHRIGPALYAGVCSAQGWKPGKAVTEAEFLAAIQAFNSSPMGGAANREARK